MTEGCCHAEALGRLSRSGASSVIGNGAYLPSPFGPKLEVGTKVRKAISY